MKIVIEINEEDYNEVKRCLYGKGYNIIEQAKVTKNVILSLFRGIPLPKGYGDLIERDDVLAEIVRFSTEEGASVQCQQLYCDINNQPTIIEANKECD